MQPYMDTAGKLTVGVGWNLMDVGISLDELSKISKVRDFPFESTAQFLVFNLGIGTLRKCRKAIAAFREHDWQTSADAILDSRAARHTGRRYHRCTTLSGYITGRHWPDAAMVRCMFGGVGSPGGVVN